MRADRAGEIGYREIRFGQLPERADVAQFVEHHLAKVRVAGSNPVVRSKFLVVTRPGGRVA